MPYDLGLDEIYDIADEEPTGNICSSCGEECDPKHIDTGIGPYEFWGSKGNDVNYEWVSDCCEAEILDEDF